MTLRLQPLVAPCLLTALSACTRHYTLPEIDVLARTGTARTIVLEEEFSLYSPLDLELTREYVPLVRNQMEEVFALFGVESGIPITVELRENADLGADFQLEGEQLSLKSLSLEPHDGVLGRAGASLVIVEVAAPRRFVREDGRSITSVVSAATYRDTVRHELAHVAEARLGLPLDDWLGEGLAHAVAWCPLGESRLRVDPPASKLAFTASLPRDLRSVAFLLGWEQRFPPTDEDRVARLFAFSLVVFLLEHDGAPFREAILRIAALNETQILALEGAWSAWLDGIAAKLGGSTEAAQNGSARGGGT